MRAQAFTPADALRRNRLVFLRSLSLALLLFTVAAEQAGGETPEAQLRALVREAQSDMAAGRNADALARLQQAPTLVPGIRDESLLAALDNALGNAFLAAGRHAEAEQALRSSIERARKSNAAGAGAAPRNDLGNLLAAQGRFGDAAGAYREALDIARQAQDKAMAVRAAANLARALSDDARPTEAAAMLAELAQEARALEASRDKAYALLALGRLYARLRASGAHDALREALAVADAIDDARARSYALGYLGELYEQAARHEEAQRLTQHAIAAAQRSDAAEILYRWQWQGARLLKAQGHADRAISAYRNAVHTLSAVRQDLGARGSFRQSIGPVYSELADLLLRRSAIVADEKRVTQYLVEARSTMEQLKGAELQDYFQDDCVAALRARTKGIDRLEPHTAALYPIILPDRLELLLTLPDGMKRFTTPVDAQALIAEIRAFRLLLEKKITHQYYPHARKLYDWLIGPIAAELEKQKIATLVIVPDGALRTIPLAALHDGKEFLVARYALATTPGLTLTDPRPLARKDIQLQLNGLTEAVQGFPPLPHVADELKTVHGLYGGRLLRDKEFTVPNMEKALEAVPYSIVHIASHGQFDSDAEKTFLLTYEGKLSMSKLEQFLGLSKFRTEPVELLTLSACETAAGDDRAALGLAGVAVKAGARSALATLWKVNDPASAMMVADFYRQLRDPAVSKARALQQAQLAVLRDPRYRHPNYWSAFLLIGNWL